MLVKLKKHALLTEMFSKLDLELYAIALPEDSRVVIDHANAWGQRGNDKAHQSYAELLRNEKCYTVWPKTKNSRSAINVGVPVPESLLEVVDMEDRGIRMRQVLPSTRGNVAAVCTFANIGQELFVAETNPSYDNGQYAILEGPAARHVLPAGAVIPWNDNWENPYEPLVGQLKGGFSIVPSSAAGYYVPMQRHKQTGAVFMDIGNVAGTPVPSSYVNLPKNEKEEQIFARKVHAAFKLELNSDMKVVMQGMRDASHYTSTIMYFTQDNYQDYSPFYLSTTASNYWAINKADVSQVSYLPQSKVAGVLEKGQDPWDNPSRQTTTWGKLFKGFLNTVEYSSNSEVEKLSTMAVAAATEMFAPDETKPELLIVHGRDIGKYYQVSNYIEARGELGGSCMRSKGIDFFSMYNDNPNQIGLLIAKDRKYDKIHGRALVWTMADGRRFIDRRYGISPAVQTRMLNWALKEGMVNIWGGQQYTKGEGNCSVILEKPYHARYPYMDSMYYFNPLTGELANHPTKGIRYATVKDTSGGREHIANEVACAVSNIVAPKAVMQETVSKRFAFKEHLAQLRSGLYEIKSETRTDELEGGAISIHEAVDAYVKLPTTPDGKRQKPETKVTSSANPGIAQIANTTVYALKDELVLSPLDGGYIKKSDAVQQADGSYCLPASADKYQAILAKKRPNKAMKEAGAPAELAVPLRREVVSA